MLETDYQIVGMRLELNATLYRFASSCGIALLLTFALLYLMTRLILPVEHDFIDSRMIRNVEFVRSPSIVVPVIVPKFDSMLEVDKQVEYVSDSLLSPDNEVDANRNTKNSRKNQMIDWWAEARKLRQDSDLTALRGWFIEQGYDRYTSVMQGPPPVTKSVQKTPLPSRGEQKVYKNMYGELETDANDNCVMQMQSTGRESTEFERNLPPRIFCKPAPKKKLSFQQQE